MKVVQINSVYGIGSTGRIVKDICQVLQQRGHQGFAACGCSELKLPNLYVMESRVYQKANILKTRLFGRHGFYNKAATKGLIRWLDEIQPDVIHLHNLHGHYLNVELLFQYLKKIDKPVVWTLHDCWPFTGHCSHFQYVGCVKWKDQCSNCPQLSCYPITVSDRSTWNYERKKELFTSLKRMTIVTPSNWLADLVKQSFLKEYPIEVIQNGIDLDGFRPTPSNLRDQLGIGTKKVILGIVSNFKDRKGGSYFLKLADQLDNDCIILLLSLQEDQQLPKNIISLPRTNRVEELAQIYTLADVFVNPTLEDNFPTVNLEALACGTPVVTFQTGGSGEAIDETCGLAVTQGDVDELASAVQTCINGVFSSQACIQRSKLFDKNLRYSDYLNIYQQGKE